MCLSTAITSFSWFSLSLICFCFFLLLLRVLSRFLLSRFFRRRAVFSLSRSLSLRCDFSLSLRPLTFSALIKLCRPCVCINIVHVSRCCRLVFFPLLMSMKYTQEFLRTFFLTPFTFQKDVIFVIILPLFSSSSSSAFQRERRRYRRAQVFLFMRRPEGICLSMHLSDRRTSSPWNGVFIYRLFFYSHFPCLPVCFYRLIYIHIHRW